MHRSTINGSRRRYRNVYKKLVGATILPKTLIENIIMDFLVDPVHDDTDARCDVCGTHVDDHVCDSCSAPRCIQCSEYCTNCGDSSLCERCSSRVCEICTVTGCIFCSDVHACVRCKRYICSECSDTDTCNECGASSASECDDDDEDNDNSDRKRRRLLDY